MGDQETSQGCTRRQVMQTMLATSTLLTVAGGATTALDSTVLAARQTGSPEDANKRWQGSALGNLYPFIKQQQQRTQQSLAYLHRRPKNLEQWKAEARAKVFDLLSYNPEPCSPRPQVIERVDKGDYILEYLKFATTTDIEVPAYFLIPKRAKFPVPAVIALHDHGGFYYWGKEKVVETDSEHPVLTAFRKRYYDGVSFPALLARHGYAVIVIDMFYFGERRLILDEDLQTGINDRTKFESEARIDKINQRESNSECVVFRNMLHSGFTWGGVLVWDDIRTVDYLETRPEVDKNRIACTGLSVGGWRTTFLAALDSRIKAACIACWMTSFRYLIPHHEVWVVPSGMVPGLLNYLDYPDLASVMMPTPLLVVHGQRDELFPPEGVKAAFATIGQCYSTIGKPERFKTYIFDGPHKYPLEAQRLMIDWFDRWV
jgi:dienelactone hydrolase